MFDGPFRVEKPGSAGRKNVTRLRAIFRDDNGLLRTVFAANDRINTADISHRCELSSSGWPRTGPPRPPRRRLSRHKSLWSRGRVGLFADSPRSAKFAMRTEPGCVSRSAVASIVFFP